MNAELLTAVKTVNDAFLYWQVELSPSGIIEVLKYLDWYNEFNPAKIEAGIGEINKAIPPMNFGNTSFNTPNPNNGKLHHKFRIGREGSMVMYLDINKYYLPKDFNYAQLDKELGLIAKFMKADEYWIVKNSEPKDHYNRGEFTYRFWWD